jgi:NAD-dependent SIR2 family protein deacetylase
MSLSNAEICQCPYCANDIDFPLDDFLLNEIRGGRVVIFAGAGISTENSNSAPHSLYTEIAVKCGLINPDLAFPDLAQLYVARPDGRFQLLQLIQDRFEYVSKFADLRHQATRFYDELSTMPYLQTFITTNWDRYFEERCDAQPFVYDADMRFWDIPFRKVLKIHGTIDNYSSLIATRGDYDQCAERLKTSLIGGKLKEVLSNHTCVFIGYSMQDDDFKEIFEFVRSSLGAFVKQHYVVSPNVVQDELPANLTAIRTDGTYFLSIIKQHLCSCDGFISDEIYHLLEKELWDVQEAHNALWDKYSIKTHPQMLLSAMYQDGLIHGYQMARDMKKMENTPAHIFCIIKSMGMRPRFLTTSRKEIILRRRILRDIRAR